MLSRLEDRFYDRTLHQFDINWVAVVIEYPRCHVTNMKRLDYWFERMKQCIQFVQSTSRRWIARQGYNKSIEAECTRLLIDKRSDLWPDE